MLFIDIYINPFFLLGCNGFIKCVIPYRVGNHIGSFPEALNNIVINTSLLFLAAGHMRRSKWLYFLFLHCMMCCLTNDKLLNTV